MDKAKSTSDRLSMPVSAVPSGKCAFFLVVGVLFALFGFVYGLHHGFVGAALILLVAGGAGAVGALFCWGGAIWCAMQHERTDQTFVSGQASVLAMKKFRTGLWLSFVILCAFGLSFLMIPLYYIINGTSGHVHGAAAQVALEGKALGVVTKQHPAYVYLTRDVNIDALPIRVVMHPKKVTLSPGESEKVEVKIINPLDQPVRYVIHTKLAPANAAEYLHYTPTSISIDIPARGEKRYSFRMHLKPGLPLAARTITLAQFILGERRGEDWKKMQKDWHVFS